MGGVSPKFYFAESFEIESFVILVESFVTLAEFFATLAESFVTLGSQIYLATYAACLLTMTSFVSSPMIELR